MRYRIIILISLFQLICLGNSWGEENSDYRFSFRARNPEDAEQVQIWASFRNANRFDHYMVGLKGGLLDQVYLMRLGYMGTDEFLGERPLRFHPVPGEWYRIKVEVVGQRIRVFVGDEQLPYIDVTDKNGGATMNGGVTLGGGWIETEYDDLVVTPLASNALEDIPNTEFRQQKTATQKETQRQEELAKYRPIVVSTLHEGRTDISLDGRWLFRPEGDDKWHTMTVPDFWTPIRIWLHGETMPSPRGSQPKGVSDTYYQRETDRCENYTFDYNKVKAAWYRQWVELPDGVKNKIMTLHFDAVSKAAEVFVNGQKAGSHIGMFADFSVDVSRLLHPGKNLIEVHVVRNKDDDSGAKNDQLDAHYALAQGNAVRESAESHVTSDLLRDMPHGFFGNDPAGIWQPVRLTITNHLTIDDVFIRPRLDGATFEATVRNYGKQRGLYDLYTKIVDKASGETLYEGVSARHVELGHEEVRTLTYDIAGLAPKPWSPQHPNLYDFIFLLRDSRAQSKCLDSIRITSGFRTFEVKDGLFYLNGVKYWLRGANQVPSAICPNDEALAHTFYQLMKAGNIEVTRTHTAPFNELWMKAADEEGIAVSFEGTWPWLMLENRPIPDLELLQLWRDEMKQLMRKYRNHPALILWTVNNEMKFYDLDTDHQRAMQKMTVISDLVREMRQTDPTRPMVYDSNYFSRGKAEKYGQAFMDSIDDGDVDDVHAYYNWYDYSLFRFFKGEFERYFKMPDRPLISQEMSTGYPNNETGHPTRSYQIIHQNPMSLVGYKGYDFCNPQYFLETQGFITGELAEALRRTSPNGSGILHFSLHTWFQQAYDAQHIKPWPAYHALSRALQPVLVSAEIWGRNLYGGSQLTTRFYVVNDLEDGRSLQPTQLTWRIVDTEGRLMKQGELQVRAIAHYEHYSLEPDIILPEVSCKQKVKLLLSLTENGQEISKNEYVLTLAPKTLLKATLPKDTRIIKQTDSLSPAQLKALHKFVRKGGKLLILNAKEVARQLYPEYIKGWIIPTEGDICYMEREEDRVFEGIDPMELRYWNDNQREMPRACNATLKTVRSENVEELAGQMKIHAYIDGGKPEDRIKRIDQMRGFTLLRIHEGKGQVLVSTMCTEKASTDPIAAQLLNNLINNN
ncbi:MAG: glycoside hydrolase family 2 [Prevotella sp.]|nr:glycoside hydrolase family 2 [Prevotella sp.]